MVRFTLCITLTRLGPILVNYVENLSAMSMGSVIVLPSDLNDEDGDGLFLRLLITSFITSSNSFQVVLRSFFASSSLES